MAAGEVHEGRICTSLVAEVQIEWVRVERIKDVYIRPWLLEKIRSARKELSKYQKVDFTSQLLRSIKNQYLIF